MNNLYLEEGISKITFQTEQEGLYNACAGAMSRLVWDDIKMTKRAASEVFPISVLNEHKPDKDHFLLHLIAMGGHPTYCPNRNGDAFPSDSLRDYHDTFVKFGHFFREHKHHDPVTDGIGLIKASAYNPQLDRVELLVWGHKKKAAEEYEAALNGKELSFSMSSRVPYDRCSICDNKAKNVASYCSHLKNHMGAYMDEHNKFAFAYNDKPKFFDISKVGSPADRIAHYIAYKFPDEEEQLMKAASSSKLIIPSHEWARFEQVRPLNTSTPISAEDKAVVTKLANAEQWFDDFIKHPTSEAEYNFFADVLPKSIQDNGVEFAMNKVAHIKPGSLFGMFAKSATFLPMSCILEYAGVEEIPKQNNHGIFSYIEKNATCGHCDTLGDMAPMFSGYGERYIQNDSDCDAVDDIMEAAASKYSCKMEPVKHRTIEIIIKSASNKASFNAPAMVKEASPENVVYAAYQVAAYKDFVKRGYEDPDLLAKLIVATNYYRSAS